jgi:putative transposase
MRRVAKNNSVSEIGLHIIFCTKYRKQILKGAVEVECKHILSQTCAEYGWEINGLEIMPDHVHIFVQAAPTDRPSDMVRTLKNISAVHIFAKYPHLKGRLFWGSGLWSNSTYYGSVGQVTEEMVKKYIDNQRNQKGNSSQGTSP